MSSIRRIVYIGNVRLPTEKAHGLQIVKMCEAFVQNGVRAVLIHPFRNQPDSLKNHDVFDYYCVPRVAEVRTLSNIDIVRFEKFLPKLGFLVVSFIHNILWSLYAAISARKEHADLYYTRESTIAYWLLRLRLPTVYEVHSLPKRIQKIILRKISTHPALKLVVALTSFIEDRLVSTGFPAKKIILLPSATDLSLFADLPNKQECRQRLGLPKDREIIGYVGRFQTMDMEKGIPELVQAMAHLSAVSEKEPLLVCVGGPMNVVPAYLEIARHYRVSDEKLRFVDRVSNHEVPFWIRAFDIAVAPFPNSEHYNYYMSPLKLFEYMAAGVPIVASNLPSIREILHHGENAWLVEPGNAKALAEGVQRLLQDAALQEKIAAEARRAVKRYSWELRAAAILRSTRDAL